MKAIFCLLGKLPNPLRTLPAASGCASVSDALTAVPAKEKNGAAWALHPHCTGHSIIECFVYFLLPAELPAHAAALFSAHPLSGFPAQSSVPQANPAFPIWSCGTLHRSFSFVPEASHTLRSARWCAGAFCQNRSLSYRHQMPFSLRCVRPAEVTALSIAGIRVPEMKKAPSIYTVCYIKFIFNYSN